MMKPNKLNRGDGDDGSSVAISVEDRISHLHDVVLADIISFLPTKDAVATSVLSKRWRHLFTWVSHLDFDDSPISHCLRCPHLIDSFPVFKMYVDNVLQSCQSENITSFRLCFGWGKKKCNPIFCNEACYPELNPTQFTSWLSFPLTRGVKELDICVRVKQPNKLPPALFRCKTLQVLKLNTNLDLEVPSSLCLPNLKHLSLTLLEFPDDDSVTRLVLSCPSLEHLELNGHWKPEVPIAISSPSIRRLAIRTSGSMSIERCKLTLDVPNLESLFYQDRRALQYSIGDMNSLIEADIKMHCHFRRKDYSKTTAAVFGSLTNVRRLFLNRDCLQGLEACTSNYKLPVFRNLTCLEFGCASRLSWHKLLFELELLNNAPLLETIVFQEGFSCYRRCDVVQCKHLQVLIDQQCQLWRTSQITPPSCFGFHLKRILIQRCFAYDMEVEIIKYFLRNALALEELTVRLYSDVPSEDGISFENTLRNLPRGSPACSIKVQPHPDSNVQYG